MTATRHDVTPNPERIAESLRDTGYVFETAVADIVDNSIAAQATQVDISLKLDVRGRVLFSVTDNGIGMNQAGIVNALRYGADQRDDPSSLGKFGLGLKTASTAFARRLIVTSRDGENSSIVSAAWDLDEVSDFGWSVEQLEPTSSELGLLDSVASGHSGTVVRWEKADRVMRDYSSPTGTFAQNALDKKANFLRDHLALVFHRFVDPKDERAENLTINLNGVPIEAFDPFGFGAEILADTKMTVRVSADKEAEMTLRVFVLPRGEELSADLGDEAKKARLGNKTQGIYTYRENRLIHGPDWLGIWTQEPHFTLLRAELSFDHKLDEAFQVDIKKSTIVLDDALIGAITKVLNGPRREAGNRYRDGRKKAAASKASPSLHGPSNAAIADKAAEIPAPTLTNVDRTLGKATIANDHGPVTVEFSESSDGHIFIESVDELPEGLLYSPTYIGKNPGVLINMSHPYYEKVYLPSRTPGMTIQAIDSLLWALASAEFRTTRDSTRRMFEDIRYDVSKALRRLVEDLPEPDLED